MQIALETMDALQNWFFWTWKIGPTTTTGTPQSPMWSYQLGLQNGWLPTDPRTSLGSCEPYGPFAQFDGPLQPWQTGGAGAGDVNPTQVESWSQWPAPTLSNIPGYVVDQLPIYTPTGVVPTLTPVTGVASAGDGWYDSSDTISGYVGILGCDYPEPWEASGAPLPTEPQCTGGVGYRRRRSGGNREEHWIPRATPAPR